VAHGCSSFGSNLKIRSKKVSKSEERLYEFKEEFIEKCCDPKQLLFLNKDDLELSVVQLELIDE
jgi:hypothetical protein